MANPVLKIYIHETTRTKEYIMDGEIITTVNYDTDSPEAIESVDRIAKKTAEALGVEVQEFYFED